jgi:predicted secreted Zn-dependent protease
MPHSCREFFGVRGYCRHDKRFSDAELALVWRRIAEDERAKRQVSEYIAQTRGDALIRHMKEDKWRDACEGVRL